MDADKLRRAYIEFFRNKGHAEVPGASLIPEGDPSVLFTTAGMHPLVPFLLGEPHPAGPRLVDCQKCVRTDDITEVGDDVHLTFFEMLGNWSLGDYWKSEAIGMSFEFLTGTLGLDADRLWVSCFAGDDDAPRDLEAFEVWRAIGIPEDRVLFLPKKDNWWGPAGRTGPCGPDTEMFYDMNPGGPAEETPVSAPGRFWEVWNDVFMQYDKTGEKQFEKLPQKNVDTGLGLERTLAIMQNVPSLYETDLFVPIVDIIKRKAHTVDQFATRVVADHARAAVFILAEGTVPGNTDQPYIVRRLIRRAVRYGRVLGIGGPFLSEVAGVVIDVMGKQYPELRSGDSSILEALDREEVQFQKTLARGEKEFRKALSSLSATSGAKLPGEVVFRLYDTYGFPPELTSELAAEAGVLTDDEKFRDLFSAHQEKSRAGAAARFAGGLAERSPETTRLHTATHLLHQALRDVLGDHVQQRGSNITVERLRFDFSHPAKLSAEELASVEAIVNEKIAEHLAVSNTEVSPEEADRMGALGFFGERYGEIVKVYSIGEYSKEICGGPHVGNTRELGHFKIVKEEAVSAGTRRIKAVVTGVEV